MVLRLNGLARLVGAAAVLLGAAGTTHAAGDPALGEKKFYTCYGCHGNEN